MERKAVAVKIAAVISYLLLLDAAVETLLSRSPLWWILVPLLSGYLVISAILWRRSGRPPAFIVSLAILLVLLALTAWLPDGATRGIVLLGQPTSTVLIVITAVAVLIAVIRLVREPSIPRTLRWIIGALAVYSLSAFVFGMFAGVAYPDVFHEARWRVGIGDRGLSVGLPAWLQGAFIGAFVLLPAALVVQGLRRFFEKRPAPGGPRQLRLTQGGVEAIALSLCLFMALGALRAPATGRISPATALPSKEITRGLEASVNDLTSAIQAANPSTLPPGERMALQLERALPELEARANAIPRDSFDVQAVVDKVSRDPVALFNWVRDQTRLLPYRGLLKGPAGTLMDRGGNSLDRALLLNALLRVAGGQTQLARATLSEEQARRVIERSTQALPQMPGGQLVQIPGDLIESLARFSGMRPADARQHLERVTAEQRRVGDLTRTRIREQAQALANAVGRPHPQDAQGETAALLESLKDHWWLRWMNEGAWVDLDPTLPDAAPGSVLAAAQESYEADGLPEDVFHVVTIRVVIERWADGRLSEQPVLTYTFRSADHHASQFSLIHRPTNFPSMGFLREKGALERFKGAVVGIRGWVPVLTVGGQEISQSGFTDGGEVKDKGALAGGPGAQAGERVRDILSGPRGAYPTSPPQDQKGQLTAEWVDYEVRVPRQTTTTIRRQVFDMIGSAARSQGRPSLILTDAQRLDRGLALFGTTFILSQATWIPSSFVDHLFTDHLLKQGNGLIQQLRRGVSGSPDEQTRELGKLKPIALPVYQLALARKAWSLTGSEVYLSRPNLLTYSSNRLRVAPSGRLHIVEQFDIVTNEVSVRPRSGGDAFLTRMEQGVADTVAEAVLLTGLGVVRNVSEIFAVSKTQGIEWITIRSTREAALRVPQLSPDVRARLEGELGAGYTVVAPARPVLLAGQQVSGWWRVDPHTGQTLGIGETGAGQSSTETFLMMTAAYAIPAITCFALVSLDPCSPGVTDREAIICALLGLAAIIGGFAFAVFFTATNAAAILGALILGGSAQLGFGISYLTSDHCPSGPPPSPPPTTGGPPPAPSPPPECREMKLGPLRIQYCPSG
jgi:hypothetical protein